MAIGNPLVEYSPRELVRQGRRWTLRTIVVLAFCSVVVSRGPLFPDRGHRWSYLLLGVAGAMLIAREVVLRQANRWIRPPIATGGDRPSAIRLVAAEFQIKSFFGAMLLEFAAMACLIGYGLDGFLPDLFAAAAIAVLLVVSAPSEGKIRRSLESSGEQNRDDRANR